MAGLDDILSELVPLVLSTSGDVVDGGEGLSGVSSDSRRISSGMVFVAVPGAVADGRAFIADALDSGAAAVVHEGTIDISMSHGERGAVFIQVSDARLAYALLAEFFHGHPARNLRLAAVTGTNGKTTTAFLLKAILADAGRTCGLISTVERSWPGKRLDSKWTTPDANETQETLAAMKQDGCSDVVMEASSHALAQKRLGSIKFAAAIFTNLSGDHLDYHKDMESYFLAKKVLFERHIADGGVAVVNIDDPYGRRLAAEIATAEIATFGTAGNADYKISDVALSEGGVEFRLTSPDGHALQVALGIPGEFNAFNATAALVAAESMGVPLKEAVESLAAAKGAPGRMERISERPLVVVDYAHTDDALRNALSTLRETLEARLDGAKLTVVFGCGGDRDRTKRPRMAAVAAEFADNVVVANDNPRTEAPQRIIDDILAGFPKGFVPKVEPDRMKAIESAVLAADDRDIVLVAGKGHETYQEINGVRHHFDDREAVMAALEKRALDRN